MDAVEPTLAKNRVIGSSGDVAEGRAERIIIIIVAFHFIHHKNVKKNVTLYHKTTCLSPNRGEKSALTHDFFRFTPNETDASNSSSAREEAFSLPADKKNHHVPRIGHDARN